MWRVKMFFMFDFDDEKNGIPSFDQMMKPIMVVLQKNGGSASVSKIDKEAIDFMNLPKEITSIMHKKSTNRTEVSYRLAWARTYLKKYGLIRNKSRGVWTITGKFDGNIESIDSKEITKKVRTSIGNSDGDDELESAFESAPAFERMVISLFKGLATEGGRKIDFYSNDITAGADFILPNGIEQYTQPLEVIVKYVNATNQKNSLFLNQIMSTVKEQAHYKKILLVLNFSVSEAQARNLGENVIIWDQEELLKRINPDEETGQYLLDPKHAFMEDVIAFSASKEERQKEKEGYLRKLKKEFDKGDITLFLGAGVSIDGGIPEWTSLIKQLHIHMISKLTEDRPLDSEKRKLLSELALDNRMGSPLLQMRYIKSAFSKEVYYGLVHDAIYGNKTNIDAKLLSAIAKICAPQRRHSIVKNVVTYNFDDLLEKKFDDKDIQYNVISDEEHRQAFDKLNIYHVHGHLPNDVELITEKMNLVFLEDDYHKVYRDSYSWSNLIQLSTLRENTCLFIGCSLTDPNVRRLLDVAARKEESPRHFAFMKKNKIEGSEDIVEGNGDVLDIYQGIDDNIQSGYYKKLGINIIWVNEFEEIPIILEGLME